MPKPRLQMEIILDTLVHANTVKSALDTQLHGVSVIDSAYYSVMTHESGSPELVGDFRFNTDVDRDAIKNWIMNQIQGTNVKNWIQTGSRISFHECTHDDPTVLACSNQPDYSEWIK